MLTISLIALLMIASAVAGFLAGVKHGKRFTAIKDAVGSAMPKK